MNTSLLVGALIGLILGIVGNYVFEAYGWKTRAAKRSKKRAKKRQAQLNDQLERATAYHEDRKDLHGFLLSRILILNLLWIAQSAIDYLLGLVSNGTYALSYFWVLSVDRDVVQTSANTTASALGALLLILILNWGFRAYRTWERATNYERFKSRVRGELGELQAVLEDGGAE